MSVGVVLILGAGSDIGRACAHFFAAKGHTIQLAARAPDRLTADQTDLQLRYGVSVSLHAVDALETDTHADFVQALPVLPDVAISVIGLLGTHTKNLKDTASAVQILRSNFEGPATLLGALATRFEARGSGTLVGVSSVAGNRGRASNYIYGAAKAGFTAYLSGLRHRLFPSGVHVVTVLPGFVDTAMTQGMNLPPRLTAQPGQVAEAIYYAIVKKRNIIYFKPIWRVIMAIIWALPEEVFKRTRL